MPDEVAIGLEHQVKLSEEAKKTDCTQKYLITNH